MTRLNSHQFFILYLLSFLFVLFRVLNEFKVNNTSMPIHLLMNGFMLTPRFPSLNKELYVVYVNSSIAKVKTRCSENTIWKLLRHEHPKLVKVGSRLEISQPLFLLDPLCPRFMSLHRYHLTNVWNYQGWKNPTLYGRCIEFLVLMQPRKKPPNFFE